MSLSVPSYAAPQFRAPVADVYAWITTLTLDFGTGGGTFNVNVHPDAESAAGLLQPLDTFVVTLGQSLGGGLNFATLSELTAAAAAKLKSDPTLDPFAALRAALYDALKTHPRLAGAKDVT